MARYRRVDFAGACHHVMSRGNRGADIFRDDRDRTDFLALLGKVAGDCQWQIYAYCLMNNHYHLLLKTPKANLSKGMRNLNGPYTQRLNWRQQTSGHVFQGRFKSILVEDDSYFLELFRYIYMNPVKDGFVKVPQAWKWSSYGFHIGHNHHQVVPEWFDLEAGLKLFGKRRESARKVLAKFVTDRQRRDQKSHETLATLLEQGGVIGSRSFVRRYDDNSRQNHDERNAAIVKDHRSGLSQREIASRHKLNQSTVQRILSAHSPV